MKLKVTSYIKRDGDFIPLDSLTEEEKATFRKTMISDVETTMSKYYSRRYNTQNERTGTERENY